MTYTVAQMATLIDVSQNTIRNWERDLTPYLQATRDESGTRHYDDRAVVQFKRVSRLRDIGLPVSTIRDILEVMADEQGLPESLQAAAQEVAAAGFQETTLDTVNIPLPEQPQVPVQAALDTFQEGLKAFIEQNLHSIDVVQREILADLQQLTEKTHKRRWLRR
ncbi:MAG: MerR family transcriptional regulator [Firmicutes bacterium]|nr:MerR family transcriptional regulator [Bacillota bacterium]